MAESENMIRWHPSAAAIVAGGMVVAGFLLSSVSWWFLLLAALGTFGPGMLREFGWLRDKDEFQRRAAHRAGYHAFLVVGLVAFALVAWFRSGEREIRNPGELATFFLALLWCTWFFSSLMDFWGPRKTATRVLIAFGCVWLVFTVVSNLGSEWSGWTALLLHPLLSLPFFFLSWLSQRWPRISGALLVVTAIFFIRFFGWFREDHPLDLATQGVTFILFVGPLLASGIALLGIGREDMDEEAEELSPPE